MVLRRRNKERRSLEEPKLAQDFPVQRGQQKDAQGSRDVHEISTSIPPSPLCIQEPIAAPWTGRIASYTIAKWSILRFMACIYFISFLGALHQNEGLMGSRGLQPAMDYFDALKSRYLSQTENSTDFYSLWNGFSSHPTIFWVVPLSDHTMRYVIQAGLVLSALVMVGVNSWLLQLLLWMLYFSIVTISEGTSFYSYGWESQILETGFLAIFLCSLPYFRMNGLPQMSIWERRSEPPSPIVLWLFSWLCFRISIGAGLIKLRGSSCWTDRSCLYYHFETQPIPSPLSFIYHFLPRRLQSRMVDTDLFVQVYTSWFVLIPVAAFPQQRGIVARIARTVARVGGYMQAGFMVAIALSGNFAVLNHLTIIPALACLDDACWPQWFAFLAGASDEASSAQKRRQSHANSRHESSRFVPQCRLFVEVLLMIWILHLSRPVVENLLQIDGARQVMNRSFGDFRLVNTYGAFGSVGRSRYEAIVQISDDLETWHELEFPCKPGNLYRRPCFCAPYHYRIDWNIWFLGFKPHEAYLRRRESWLFNLLSKLLENKENVNKTDTLSLPTGELGYDERPWLTLFDSASRRYLKENFYEKDRAPLYAKVDMYHYEMAASFWTILGQKLRSYFLVKDNGEREVAWWKRRFEENLIPPLEFNMGRLKLAS